MVVVVGDSAVVVLVELDSIGFVAVVVMLGVVDVPAVVVCVVVALGEVVVASGATETRDS